jgi:hypothetical protein
VKAAGVRRRARAGAGLVLAAVLALALKPAGAAVIVLTPSGNLAQALASAADGDEIQLLAGDYRGQVGVIEQRRLTLRGVGGRPVLHAEGRHAEGKALLVVRGGQVLIEQIEFRGARVPDGNGAGIRFERGDLTLRRCAFFDNEMGLLSSNTPDAELLIEDCEFGQAPHHEGPLHHLLYVGTMGSLRLSGSRFSGGWRGHLLKSRAARNVIVCNQFVDGDDGEASYELDLPNAGLAWVLGNVIAQGPRPQNTALLAFGAERQLHPDSALFVAHNSFVNGADVPGAFVRQWPERQPAGCVVELRNNLLLGAAIDGSWGRIDHGNVWRPLAERDRSAGAGARLLPTAAALPHVPAAGSGRGLSLVPTHEITLPVGMRPLAARDRWRPGAFQD